MPTRGHDADNEVSRKKHVEHQQNQRKKMVQEAAVSFCFVLDFIQDGHNLELADGRRQMGVDFTELMLALFVFSDNDSKPRGSIVRVSVWCHLTPRFPSPAPTQPHREVRGRVVKRPKHYQAL